MTSLSADDALLTDEALAEGFADRNVRALEIAYDRHARAVFALAVKLLGDPEAAEEIVQETFLKLWHRPETYVPMRGRLVTWLLGVAHHRSVDRLRRRRLEQRHGTDARLVETGVDHHDPLDDVLSTLRGEAVARALATLPTAQRLAVELAYLKGMTQVEIAEHLGEPLGTIKTRLRLAMQKLRGSLELAEIRP
ncbi:MAG: sigma-70 family RNA polymerase sigma factor [Chloroflexi bacterium]|nr:sigma-70 family RNA polymerase sigma factor [Chloroflexota bacterium]